jgi:hypothetical protein
MPRISTKSNPTGIIEIADRDVDFVIEQRDGIEQFRLLEMKAPARRIPESCEVVVIVRAGQTFNRFALGPLTNWDKGFRQLDNLDPSAVRRVRILIHPPDQPKLVASAERLLHRGAGERDSLLPMIGRDLGELVWKLSKVDDEFVIIYNSKIFSTIDGISQYTPFTALVLPEALRQVLKELVNSDEKDDESGPWVDWLGWLRTLNIDEPPVDDGFDDSPQLSEWVDNAVNAFCELHKLGSSLSKTILGEG